MDGQLNRLLADRRRQLRLFRGKGSALVALALHLLVAGAILFGPQILAERQQPIEYFEVDLVPATLLGPPPPDPEPSPPPPPPAPPPPAPVPPPPAEPEPEPVAEPPPDVPVLSDPDAEPSPAVSEAGEEDPAPVAEDGPTAVQGLDDPDFVYGYYVNRMLGLIRSHWSRPPVGGDIEIVVHFRILRNGHVDQLRVVTSSGLESFDLSGLRAIQSASPLPPLPQGYRKSSLGVTLIMR